MLKIFEVLNFANEENKYQLAKQYNIPHIGDPSQSWVNESKREYTKKMEELKEKIKEQAKILNTKETLKSLLNELFFTVVASGDYKLATLFKYKEREYLNRNEIADIGELSLALLLGSEYELLDSLSYDGSAKDEDKQKYVIAKLIRSMILCNHQQIMEFYGMLNIKNYHFQHIVTLETLFELLVCNEFVKLGIQEFIDKVLSKYPPSDYIKTIIQHISFNELSDVYQKMMNTLNLPNIFVMQIKQSLQQLIIAKISTEKLKCYQQFSIFELGNYFKSDTKEFNELLKRMIQSRQLSDFRISQSDNCLIRMDSSNNLMKVSNLNSQIFRELLIHIQKRY